MFKPTLIVSSLVFLSGCIMHTTPTRHGVATNNASAQPQYRIVNVPPPAPRDAKYERGPQPTGGAWVEGYWSWNGTGWTWVEGHWEANRQGYTWEQPVVVDNGDGRYRYHDGYWRQDREQATGVYRQPGTIRVHAQRNDEQPVVQRVVIGQSRQGSTRTVNNGRGTGQTVRVGQTGTSTGTTRTGSGQTVRVGQTGTSTGTTQTGSGQTVRVGQTGTSTGTTQTGSGQTVRVGQTATSTGTTHSGSGQTVRVGQTATSTGTTHSGSGQTVRVGQTATSTGTTRTGSGQTVRVGQTATSTSTGTTHSGSGQTVRVGQTATSTGTTHSGSGVTVSQSSGTTSTGSSTTGSAQTVASCRPEAIGGQPPRTSLQVRVTGMDMRRVDHVLVAGNRARVISRNSSAIDVRFGAPGPIYLVFSNGRRQLCGAI